ASRANAELMSKVISALKASGVAERDTQTSQLSLAPQYAYEPNHPPRLTGYQASNQVRVTVRDLAKLGRVADAVVSAGATNVGEINFGLSTPLEAENSARLAAVKALEDKAALYAQATGYRIGRLVNLTESGPVGPIRPVPMMALAAKAEVATPVATGQVTVHIDVTGVFELVK
ncbi:MAG TPA: SIMPL domain-containing protein, partial [Caulobacteraceae bacterium]